MICGTIRSDGDPTGFTCGSSGCIAQLGREYMEGSPTEKHIKGLGEKLGDLETEDIEDLAHLIEEKVTTEKGAIEKFRR